MGEGDATRGRADLPAPPASLCLCVSVVKKKRRAHGSDLGNYTDCRVYLQSGMVPTHAPSAGLAPGAPLRISIRSVWRRPAPAGWPRDRVPDFQSCARGASRPPAEPQRMAAGGGPRICDAPPVAPRGLLPRCPPPHLQPRPNGHFCRANRSITICSSGHAVPGGAGATR